MKKQLLIAAVAATMASATFADVSITGGSEVTIAKSGTTVETYLGFAGKSGDTTVTIDLDLHNADSSTATTSLSGTTYTTTVTESKLVKNAYLKTSVAGIAVKAGQWKSGASNLGRSSYKTGAYNLSTSVGGVKVAFEETASGSSNSVTVSGTVAGVAVSHKMNNNADSTTETKLSGSFGGVALAYHAKEASATATNTAISASTTVGDVKIAYTTIDIESALSGMDGAISDTTSAVNVGDHNALTLTTAVAGNTVTFKRYELNDVSNNKIIVKRGNLKATYNDNADTLEVELAVKF
jgi:hypothetical protein